MIDKKIEALEQKIKDLDKQIAAYEVNMSDPYNRYQLTSRRRSLKKELALLVAVRQPIYKIRDTETGLYSHGTLNKWHSGNTKKTQVTFSKKGKSWTSEALIKRHLMRCITDAYGVPGN